jgi:hypothetical protein
MRKAERCMELMELVGAWLDAQLRQDLEQPRLFPTPQDGVEAEWRIGRLDLSVEFDPHRDLAEWHQLDLDSSAVVEQQVALQDAPGLIRLGLKLQRALASSIPISEPEETAQ